MSVRCSQHNDPGLAPGFLFLGIATETQQDGCHGAWQAGDMDAPADLEILGRAFLAALVARLVSDGAAVVFMLLANELRRGKETNTRVDFDVPTTWRWLGWYL